MDENLMDWSDWEYNCARSWESHILQMQDAAYMSLQEEDDPYELNF